MDDWDLTCKDIIDKYDPEQATPVQYLNGIIKAHSNNSTQLLYNLHIHLQSATSRDRRLANAVTKLRNRRNNKDRAIHQLQNLFPADPAGDPINFIPEVFRPPTLSFDLTAQLLGLTKEVIANGLEISLIWAAADSGGLILPLMHNRRKRSAREVVTPQVVKLARQELKHRRSTVGDGAVSEVSPTRIDDTNSDAFSLQSSTFEIGRSAPPNLSLGFESDMDYSGSDDDVDGTVDPKENGIGLFDDMDGTVGLAEDDNTSTDMDIAVGQKRHSTLYVELAPKRPRTAATSLTCLEPERKLNDECLNCLIDLAIRDHQQAFGAVDSLTLQAHAQSTSAVGSKAPSRSLIECIKMEYLLLPFYHISKQHWTLFVYHKSQTLLVHYDSLTNSASQRSLAQVYGFLTWLYQLDSLDYQIETRRIAHQSNSFDCGIYVIETARCLAAGIDPEKRMSQVTASQLREEYSRAIATNRMDAASLCTDLVRSPPNDKLMAPVQVQSTPVKQPSPFSKLDILLKTRHNKYKVLLHRCAYLRTSLAAFRVIVQRRQSLDSELELSRVKLSEARDWLSVNATSDIAVLLAAGKAVMSSSIRQRQVSAATQAVFASLEALESDTFKCTEIVRVEEKECRRLESILDCHAGLQEVLCLVNWIEERCKAIREEIERLERTARVCEVALAYLKPIGAASREGDGIYISSTNLTDKLQDYTLTDPGPEHPSDLSCVFIEPTFGSKQSLGPGHVRVSPSCCPHETASLTRTTPSFGYAPASPQRSCARSLRCGKRSVTATSTCSYPSVMLSSRSKAAMWLGETSTPASTVTILAWYAAKSPTTTRDRVHPLRALLHRHAPNLPHVLSYYAQLPLNLFLVFFLIYIVYSFWSTVRSDVDKASEEVSAETLADMTVCAREYVDNRCDRDSPVPAIERVCDN